MTEQSTPKNWQLDHSAHAVRDIDKALSRYEALGLNKTFGRETLEESGVELVFIDCGNSLIELISPTSANSSLSKFIDKYGEVLHHVCFSVEDIEAELAGLLEKNFELIDAIPRRGAAGSRIAFIHPKSCGGVLVELCEGGHSN